MKNDNSPATKADIASVQTSIGALQTQVNSLDARVERIEASTSVLRAMVERIEQSVERTNESLRALAERMQEHERQCEWRTDAVHEDIDRILILIGNVDKRNAKPIKNHEDRITRLERHLGLAA